MKPGYAARDRRSALMTTHRLQRHKAVPSKIFTALERITPSRTIR